MLKSYLLIIYTILLLFSTSYAMASTGWIVYFEDGFKGKVIDAETKEPIEGAVAAAIYDVSEFGFPHSGSAHADVKETLTDSNGEFHISSNLFFRGPFSLGAEKTRFIIFKPGYGTYPGYDTFLIYAVKEAPRRRMGTKITEKKVSKEEVTMPEKNITNKDKEKFFASTRGKYGD